MILRPGVYETDHKVLLKLARQSPYTKGFQDVRYVQEYYTKGHILVAEDAGELLGFVCLRHCVRQPWTTIYYLGVREDARGRKIGSKLTRYTADASPHAEIRLGVDESNAGGMAFWYRLGFQMTGAHTLNKRGGRIVQMVWRHRP